MHGDDIRQIQDGYFQGGKNREWVKEEIYGAPTVSIIFYFKKLFSSVYSKLRF